MKTNVIHALLMAALLLIAAGCVKVEEMFDGRKPLEDIRILSPQTPEGGVIPIAMGESIQLGVELVPPDAGIISTEWESTDSGVMRVDRNGKVTAVGYGQANVIVTAVSHDRNGENTFKRDRITLAAEVVQIKGVKFTCNGSDAPETILIKGDEPVQLGFVTEPENGYYKEARWEVFGDLTAKTGTTAASIDPAGRLVHRDGGRGQVLLTLTTMDSRYREKTFTAGISFETDDIIRFEDRAAERACLHHFDRNRDGVLTLKEAELVTELPEEMFYNNQYRHIRSFDELRYFKNLKKIGFAAFCACEKLRSVRLPDGVEIISDLAFACPNLEGLRLPDGIRRIEQDAFFKANPNLFPEEFKLPENLEELGETAFFGLNVTSVIFGRKIRKIGGWAFANCRNLNDFTFLGETPPEGYILTEISGTPEDPSTDGSPYTRQPTMEKYRVITVHVPRDAVEKYDKKFYFKDRDLYTNELDYRKDVVYYVWAAEGRDYETCPFHILPNEEIFGHYLYDSDFLIDGGTIYFSLDDIRIVTPINRYIGNAPDYILPDLPGRTPEEMEKARQECYSPVYLRDYVISIPGRNSCYRFVPL